MFIDFNTVLKDIEGNDINVTAPGKEPEKLTLKKACINALMEPDQEKDGQKKMEKFQLAMKINSGVGKVGLKAEEIAALKAAVGKAYGPLVVGRAWELLEKENV